MKCGDTKRNARVDLGRRKETKRFGHDEASYRTKEMLRIDWWQALHIDQLMVAFVSIDNQSHSYQYTLIDMNFGIENR